MLRHKADVRSLAFVASFFPLVTVNRFFEMPLALALTLAYGHPVSAYAPGHDLSHDKWVRTRRDAMRTTKLRFRWTLLNRLFFLQTSLLDFLWRAYVWPGKRLDYRGNPVRIEHEGTGEARIPGTPGLPKFFPLARTNAATARL